MKRELRKFKKSMPYQRYAVHLRSKFLPKGTVRTKLRREKLLKQLTEAKKNGTVLSALHTRTQWEQTSSRLRGQNVPQMNFRGFKVRVVDHMKEPGFPTHWQ